jgi:hypothetical protein
MYRPGVWKGEGNDRIDTSTAFCDKANGSSDIRKVSDMLKILLLAGGIWFSLAVLFVVALCAAGSRPFPRKRSKPVLKIQSYIPKPTVRAASARRASRREAPWEMEKPVEA